MCFGHNKIDQKIQSGSLSHAVVLTVFYLYFKLNIDKHPIQLFMQKAFLEHRRRRSAMHCGRRLLWQLLLLLLYSSLVAFAWFHAAELLALLDHILLYVNTL